MKRRVIVFFCCIALIVGLAAGFVLRGVVSGQQIASGAASADPSASQQDAEDASGQKGQLVITAVKAMRAISEQDFEELSAFVDPEEGVTFTPYSTVDPTSNLTFSADDLADAEEDETSYVWGVSSSDSSPIRMTIPEYFDSYVWDADYWAVTELGIDTVLHSGNSLENVSDAYPGCHFVDFYLPATDDTDRDWSSLKLVFQQSGSEWYLVGIIHSEWTA
ncbi:MAG: hypothetical protein LUC87_04910 [Clostridiales bacterium]|nr:hypothetical protein [Clostridiales bacterium]MCD8368714.1 hypothetical protein [Clostridiales bacterium]